MSQIAPPGSQTQHPAQTELGKVGRPEPLVIAGVWRLGRELGRGASAVVFEALDTRTGARAAAKRLALGSIADVGERERELSLLRGLRHPNVVACLGAAQAGGYFYIIMELVEGSLLSLVREFGPLTEALTAGYVAQVARGLAYLEQAGVVHRDLKAANVLLTSEGVCKVTDFGISTRSAGSGSSGGGGGAPRLGG